MAFKVVTSGLNNPNDVIDEILTFITADLDAPWTIETNVNITSIATSTTTSGASRNTWVSIVPAQPNGIAHKGIISPDPTSIYIGMRRINAPEDAIQFNGTGFHNAAASPLDNFWQEQGAFLQAEEADGTVVSIPWVDFENAGPYTSLTLFGPNQTSPIDPTIPHYVYFVLEFTPGRYAHGFFGEMRKFSNWEGGWGFTGHDRDLLDSIDGQTNNKTWWNEVRGTGDGSELFLAANVNQVNKAGAGGPTRWFRHLATLSGSASNSLPYPLRQWGHVMFRDFMTGPSQATLSGFFPLVSPIVFLLDSDSTASKLIQDPLQIRMPACFPFDMFFGDITSFEPGVTVQVGGIDVVPFPVTSKLGGNPSSNFGGYFYRKRT